MAHNSVETESRAPQPPPIPARLDYEAAWKFAGPDGIEVEVHAWADWSRGDAEVRILRGLLLGSVANIWDAASLEPTDSAVQEYGREWVEGQLRYAQELLAKRPRRWAAS